MENKGKQIKPQNEITEFKPIQFDTQQLFNQVYINDLISLLKPNTTIPINIPRKFIDCFYSYTDGTNNYLYVYLNNTWQKVGSSTWGAITGTLSEQTDLQDALNIKQDILESGTNIKTINGNSLLGSGDINTYSSTFNATASNNLQDSANTERSLGGNSTTIMKSIKIYGSGTVRLKVDWYRDPSYSTQGFWYKNGVQVGSAVTDSTSYITITTDMTISFGDSVQFAITTFQTSSVGHCKNFKVYYDKSQLTNQILID